MGKRSYLQKRIQGWLPKEPYFPSPQKTEIAERHLKIKKSTVTRLALIALATFAAEFGILSILYILGLGYYTDFAGGVVAAFVTVVLGVLLSKSSQDDKSDIPKTEGGKIAFKMIGVANLAIGGLVLVTFF